MNYAMCINYACQRILFCRGKLKIQPLPAYRFHSFYNRVVWVTWPREGNVISQNTREPPNTSKCNQRLLTFPKLRKGLLWPRSCILDPYSITLIMNMIGMVISLCITSNNLFNQVIIFCNDYKVFSVLMIIMKNNITSHFLFRNKIGHQ